MHSPASPKRDRFIAAVILADQILESHIHTAGIALVLIAVKIIVDRNEPAPGEYKAAHGQKYHDVSRSRGRWSGATVLRILEDERYIGSYVIGRRAVIEVFDFQYFCVINCFLRFISVQLDLPQEIPFKESLLLVLGSTR